VILCVDAGNTATKIALVDAGVVARRASLPARAPAREIERALRRVAKGARVDGAGLSSVRPSVDATIARAIERITGEAPLTVSHRSRLPIGIAVERPAALGADRLCAAVGALGNRGRHAIVIDAGTAVTVDLVTDRVFRGGVILPGPALMLDAMARHAARLPELAPRPLFPAGALNRTDRSMRWGAGLAASGGIVAAVVELERRAGRRMPRVLTGGGAAALVSRLGPGVRFVADLPLLGLERIVVLSQRR
jgi:type III pantothenate kinase